MYYAYTPHGPRWMTRDNIEWSFLHNDIGTTIWKSHDDSLKLRVVPLLAAVSEGTLSVASDTRGLLVFGIISDDAEFDHTYSGVFATIPGKGRAGRLLAIGHEDIINNDINTLINKQQFTIPRNVYSARGRNHKLIDLFADGLWLSTRVEQKNYFDHQLEKD